MSNAYPQSQRVRDALRCALFMAYTCKCGYCGRFVSTSAHVDHVHPQSRGGERTPENLVPACAQCNQRKADKTAEEWLGRPIHTRTLTPEIWSEAQSIARQAQRNSRKRTRLIRRWIMGASPRSSTHGT